MQSVCPSFTAPVALSTIVSNRKAYTSIVQNEYNPCGLEACFSFWTSLEEDSVKVFSAQVSLCQSFHHRHWVQQMLPPIQELGRAKRAWKRQKRCQHLTLCRSLHGRRPRKTQCLPQLPQPRLRFRYVSLRPREDLVHARHHSQAPLG